MINKEGWILRKKRYSNSGVKNPIQVVNKIKKFKNV